MKKLIIVIATLLSINAFAAPSTDAPPSECEGIKVATGPIGKGYSILFSDIKKVLGGKIKLCEVNTTGGLDNLTSLATKETDIGFVQLDTWETMKVSDDNIAALQNLMTLNNNYLHVVVSTKGFNVETPKKYFGSKTELVVINNFTDLRNQKVALVGSAQLLGRKLNKQLGYNMQFIDVKTDSEAFSLVKTAKVAAAFTVASWPSGPIKTLTSNDNLTLIPFNAPITEPYTVKPLNYKNIAVYNNNSLAVRNILVTRQFTGKRKEAVAEIQSGISKQLTELKEGNYQPAWNEVNPNIAIPNMTKFKNSL